MRPRRLAAQRRTRVGAPASRRPVAYTRRAPPSARSLGSSEPTAEQSGDGCGPETFRPGASRGGAACSMHRDHLERRGAEGCRNAARLWRELVGVGFSGGYTTVKAWAARRRKAEPDVGRMSAADKGQPWRWPSGRRGARLLRAGPDMLDEADRALVARLLEAVPPLAAAVAAAQRLFLLLRRQSSEALDDVLTAMSATPLAGFTAELRKDIDAVQA